MVFFLVSVQSLLVSCAKNDNKTPVAGPGVCAAGQAYTQYGCLPTGYAQCTPGFGYAQQYGCVPPMAGNGVMGGQSCINGQVGTVMGCLPQNSCPVGYGYYYGVYNGQTGGWCYQQTY